MGDMGVIALVAALALGGVLVALSTPPARAQTTVNVTIQNFSFNPSNITVVIGVNNTVTWTNHDAVTHTVTGNDGSWGGGVAPGATYTHTFTTAGVFDYHCSIHTYMHGSVEVLGSSSSNSSTSFSSASTSTPTASSSATSTSSSNLTSSNSTMTAPPSSTTTSQTVSSQTGSATSSSAASSSEASSSSTGTGQVSGVPEFPLTGVAIVVLTALLVAAYLAARTRMGARSSLPARS